MRGVVWAVTVSAALVVEPPPSCAQTISRIDRLGAWIDHATAHIPGTFDRAVSEISRWSDEELGAIAADLSTVLTLVRNPTETTFFAPAAFSGRPPSLTLESRQLAYSPSDLEQLRRMAASLNDAGDTSENRLLKRGAMLHADATMLALPDRRPDAQPGARYRLRLSDGQPERVDTNADHWGIGRRLLELLGDRTGSRSSRRGPAGDADARLWYTASMSYMLAEGQIDPAHFDRARRLFAQEADVLFLCGAMHETLASPQWQAAMRAATVPSGARFEMRSRRDELAEAERLLRRAVDADGDLTEARIRYGRVLGQRGKHRQAVSELKKVDASGSPLLQYYAALFLADELESVGAFDEAKQAYAKAAGLFPRAQSPRLGLSRLTVGPTHVEAREALLALVAHPSDDEAPADPWLWYETAAGRRAQPLFKSLHESIARDGP